MNTPHGMLSTGHKSAVA